MNLTNLVGQTLDEKYKIERELGKGGMGAVYLATHIGTERPVAVKVIVPQFMRKAEFVERFKREARAAGRLRHPNVVDVTDFGFDDTPQGRVAYLVMEYLDGCTLGEVLEEERRLPLEWSLDILEQVSSAVQTAHEQGIIHRDLKPDNIWLEPNQRGGYTVKVLDFGIAKLEENMSDGAAAASAAVLSGSLAPRETREVSPKSTALDASQRGTVAAAENRHSTVLITENTTIAQTINGDGGNNSGNNSGNRNSAVSGSDDDEAGTLIQPAASAENRANEVKNFDLESGTAILPAEKRETAARRDDLGTRLISLNAGTDEAALLKKSTAELTRVGAVLGTPLYMSPEQCRGERLDARSDIYSLAVIAYQMLSGRTPFEGDFKSVMHAHTEQTPPPLTAKAPKRVKATIMKALSKKPEERPPSAEAFASALRAHAEGIGVLLQKSLTIYGEHLPKFLWLAILIFIPMSLVIFAQIVMNFLSVSGVVNKNAAGVIMTLLGLLSGILSIFCAYMIYGTATWIVTQKLIAPLRPVNLKTTFAAAKKRWRTFIGTGVLSAILTIIGYIVCVIPGLYLNVVWSLVAPVIMMEHLRGRAALRRSRELVKQAPTTATAAVFLMFAVPVIVSGLSSLTVHSVIKSFSSNDKPAAASEAQTAPQNQNPLPGGGENRAAEASPASEAVAAAAAAAEKNSEESRRLGDSDFRVTQNRRGVNITFDDDGDKKDMQSRVRATIRNALTQIIWLPLQILFSSFSGIIIALLYLKTRQAGGESMNELVKQFEETEEETPRRKWQQRVRQRLIQSRRVTSRP
jgi:serine/threonine protein kinase